MSESPLDILQRVYGYTNFRGKQQAIIEAALAGQDTLVLMPTGGGKSLCYQIPALLSDGVGLVVSPLIALMQDQVNALKQLGIHAAFLNSTQDYLEQQQVIDEIKTGKIQLLYVAPERLIQSETLKLLSSIPIALIAIDEAHCVSQWGHDFRKSYLSLGDLADHFPKVPRMALTATADVRTREEIVKQLRLHNIKAFVSGFDRPNIRYTVQERTEAKRQLKAFLANHQDQAGIIYCLSRKKVEATAEWLSREGFTALPYHAGLSPEERAKNQQQFLTDEGVIMVATIAFGMGIDKPDVRFVAHMDLPKSLEAYYQETGRAGRDSEPAEAWMVYGLQDVVSLRRMLDQSEASEQQKRIERSKLDAILGWCEVNECRRKHLLSYFGETHPEDCGNCDICLVPPKTWDATTAAQKLLSCVYRTGQRFGVAYVIDVLLGKLNDKVKQYQHQSLSTFGIGQEHNENQWRSIVRQLLVRNFLHTEIEHYGALKLTEKSRALLRGELTVNLREAVLEKAAKKTKTKAVQRKHRDLSETDQPLWQALRACRLDIAKSQDVPPFVIFHDSVLLEMIAQKPSNAEELLAISGVGQSKLQRYGEAFLNVIKDQAN